ncbi:MAG: hypothetical protein IT350_18580 [Deltaproteobacteria bacterium]|nr:hypothetical protein [Deltaproteobacteria bacterium]
MSISLSRAITEKVKPPRAVCVRWPFGHPLGEPENASQQRRVIQDAFDLLARADAPAIVDLPYRWRRETYADPWEPGTS